MSTRSCSKLIALALENNRDLRVAALNIERSRAQYQIQRADLLPEGRCQRRRRLSSGCRQTSPATASAETMHQYSVGLGVSSYELDLFGRVRSLKDQALEQYLATEQARRSVQISLVSQVAATYLALAADRERLQLARETLASQQASYRADPAAASRPASPPPSICNQAQTSVDAARVDIARYTTPGGPGRKRPEPGGRLAGTGRPAAADAFRNTHRPEGDRPRPAVRRAAAAAPTFSRPRTSSRGPTPTSARRGRPFSRASPWSSPSASAATSCPVSSSPARFVWNFAPQITLPIFDAGSNRANLKVAEVDRDIAVAHYEKAIQTAFREVADALAQRGTIDEQLAAQQSLTDATAESYRLSQARYDKGVDSYLTVLDSQRSLYGAQQNLISARLDPADQSGDALQGAGRWRERTGAMNVPGWPIPRRVRTKPG